MQDMKKHQIDKISSDEHRMAKHYFQFTAFLLILAPVLTQAIEGIDLQGPVRVIGSCGGTQYHVAARWPYLYVSEPGRVLILDVTDASRPELVSTIAAEPAVSWKHCDAILAGTWMLIADSERPRWVDLSNPLRPAIHDWSASSPIGRSAVTLDGLIFAMNDGLKIYNAKDPANPILLGKSSEDDPGRGYLSISRRYLFSMIWGHAGGFLDAYDISNPVSPHKVLDMDPVGARDVITSGDLLYVANDEGFAIYDFSNPKRPRKLSSTTQTMQGVSLALQGTTLYQAAGQYGLYWVDVANPRRPIVLGKFRPWIHGSACHLCIEGSRLYLADGGAGVKFFDISDPSSPTLLGEYDPPGKGNCSGGGARRMSLHENVTAVLDQDRGIKLIDISNPRLPRLMGSIPVTKADDLALSGTMLYCLGTRYETTPEKKGLSEIKLFQIFDVTDPWRPRERGSLNRLKIWGSSKILLMNGYAYAGQGGMCYKIDISNPDHPMLLGGAGGWPVAAQQTTTSLLWSISNGTLEMWDARRPEILRARMKAVEVTDVKFHQGLLYALTAEEGLLIMKYPADEN
ncbi:MAG: hypothetical protein NTX50_04325 [Candidatus Sumerlaeota bacterium]|nr:hypothetical protein [Candidatus Sumerlaeota bacterium]